ncbi:hypothetical protein HDU97_004636 [Phlyctochytrium planicorne]|nr:hypothetical protein HDU97_004636 [Phlyctochytrium planicorne]
MEFPATHSAGVFFNSDREIFFQDFEKYFTFDSFDVRRRLIPSSGLYEYKTIGTFPTVKVQDLLAVYLDFDYRKSWDPHMLEGYAITEKPASPGIKLFEGAPQTVEAISPGADSGVEVMESTDARIGGRLRTLQAQHQVAKSYYYAIKMPFPLATRDYVYSIRCWTESDVFLVEGLTRRDTQIAGPKGSIRIDDYYQQIAVKATEDGNGAILSMRYYDNPKGTIPPFVLNMAAQKGVPSFAAGLVNAAGAYGKWLENKT